MRGEGAAACPDAVALGARVWVLRPESLPEALRVEVRFEREGAGYVATLQTSGRLRATRVLRASGPGCEGLADATAVSLSMLFDLPPEASPEPAVAASPSTARNLPPARRPAPWYAWRAWLAAGGALAWQLPSKAGGLARVDALAAPTPSLLVGVGGALGPSGSVERGGGEVEVGLGFASARACWLAWGEARGPRAGACALGAVGQLRGRGQGYALDREARRAWYALGGGLLASGPLAGPLGWLAEGSALAPLGRESFSIDEIGQVYRTPALGLLTSASLTVQIR